MRSSAVSPYLFILVMTVMFDDINRETNLESGRLQGLSFTELLYADDTALLTNNVNAMNRLLSSIEGHAHYYGLNFNKGKCVAMCYNMGTQLPKFANGTKLSTAEETKYLGATISRTHNVKRSSAQKYRHAWLC